MKLIVETKLKSVSMAELLTCHKQARWKHWDS